LDEKAAIRRAMPQRRGGALFATVAMSTVAIPLMMAVMNVRRGGDREEILTKLTLQFGNQMP
jgi:hypothetical protein